MRALRVAAAGLGLLLGVWAAAYTMLRLLPAPQPEFALSADQAAPAAIVPLCAPDAALCFARLAAADGVRLLRLNAVLAGTADGEDLTDAHPAASGADPIALLAALGFEGAATLRGPAIRVDTERLLPPWIAPAVQIAAGINYPEHGRETAQDEGFIFPKPVRPTAARGEVAVRGGLLDYEIELGFVPLAPVRRGLPLPSFGLVLASDFTDRAVLMRRFRIGDIASGEGFPQAKGAADTLAVGPVLMVPHDLDAALGGLVLHLWVNGRPRQVAEPRLLVWPLPRIIAEAFARGERAWNGPDGPVALPVAEGAIAAGTLILSGTPEGTVFRAPDARQIALGVTEWLAGFGTGGLNRIMEPAIRDGHASSAYLKPGDEVVMQASGLGEIRLRVVP